MCELVCVEAELKSVSPRRARIKDHCCCCRSFTLFLQREGGGGEGKGAAAASAARSSWHREVRPCSLLHMFVSHLALPARGAGN